MKENVNMKHHDNERLALRLMAGDTKGITMTGESIDRIYDKNGALLEERVGHNLVVNSFLNLVMCLLKKQSGYNGIQYWAVGSGLDTWDSSTPNPELTATRLTSELGRMPISLNNVKFLNEEYVAVDTPTNIIEVSHVFGTEDCNGVWREFALFGGNATTDANSGIMINKRHHAIITKTEEMIIERVMRFTLSLT